MFNGCTSLTTAPTISATTLAVNCCREMFYDCTSLNYIKVRFTHVIEADGTTIRQMTSNDRLNSYCDYWLFNTAASGTFVITNAAWWSSLQDQYVIPSGWTIKWED